MEKALYGVLYAARKMIQSDLHKVCIWHVNQFFFIFGQTHQAFATTRLSTFTLTDKNVGRRSYVYGVEDGVCSMLGNLVIVSHTQ